MVTFGWSEILCLFLQTIYAPFQLKKYVSNFESLFVFTDGNIENGGDTNLSYVTISFLHLQHITKYVYTIFIYNGHCYSIQ